MSKHTPGPWGLVTSGGEPYTVFSKDVSDPSKKICLFPVPQDRKESMANARLIAAAPDMHKDLNRCLDTLSLLMEYELDGTLMRFLNDFIEEVSVTVRKAEGKDE